MRLRYPPNQAAPTLTYQLTVETNNAAPRVAETPTLGFPFELTSVQFSSKWVNGAASPITLLLALNRWTAGPTRDGYILHQITGDTPSESTQSMPHHPVYPLVLRPRIRVPTAGYRIRLVHDDVVSIHTIRCVLVLTPLD